jgi:hypothetical protein
MKMKTIKLLLILLLLLLCVGQAKAQGQGAVCQTTLTATIPVCPLIQTTTTAAVGAGNTINSGINTAYQTTITLASLTGVVAPINGTPQTLIYIDNELMAVVGTPNTTLLTVPVQRGYNSTTVAPHVSGTMVLVGAPFQFYANDPMGVTNNGAPAACTSTAIQSTPYLNYITGRQWLCSALTGTWVPGWNNASFVNGIAVSAIASVAGTTPIGGPVFEISGTNAVTGFTLAAGGAVGFNSTAYGGGCFMVIPTGIFTFTAAGNISVAGTVTEITVPITFCWNPTTLKWMPSRIA